MLVLLSFGRCRITGCCSLGWRRVHKIVLIQWYALVWFEKSLKNCVLINAISPFRTLPRVCRAVWSEQQLLVTLLAVCVCRFGHQLKRKSACSPESAGVYWIGVAACCLALRCLGRFLRRERTGGGASRREFSWPTAWESTKTFCCSWVS